MTPDRRSIEVLRTMLRNHTSPEEVAEAVFMAIESVRFQGLQSDMVPYLMSDPDGAFDRYILPLPELEGAEGRDYAVQLKTAIVARIRDAVAPLQGA